MKPSCLPVAGTNVHTCVPKHFGAQAQKDMKKHEGSLSALPAAGRRQAGIRNYLNINNIITIFSNETLMH
jgi:hypothetical protein